jgi:hypothetical protein
MCFREALSNAQCHLDPECEDVMVADAHVTIPADACGSGPARVLNGWNFGSTRVSAEWDRRTPVAASAQGCGDDAAWFPAGKLGEQLV